MKQTLGKLGFLLLAVLLGAIPATGALTGASPCATAPCCCSGVSASGGNGHAFSMAPQMEAMDCCSPTAVGRCRLRADAIPAPTCFIGSHAFHAAGWILPAGIRISSSPEGDSQLRPPSADGLALYGAIPLYLVKQTLLR